MDTWTDEETRERYHRPQHPGVDTVRFEDCIPGMQNMPPACVDLIVADPPFGLDFTGKSTAYNRNPDLVVEGYVEAPEGYGEFSEAWMAQLPRIMKPHATAYVFSGWTHLEDVLRAARVAGLTTVNHIVWKYQFGVFTRKKFVTSHYHILMLVKNPKKYYFNKVEHYPEDVWVINRKYRPGAEKNSTVLPLEVVNKCIQFSSKPGDLVFDPFMGSGTTAIAARKAWRHYAGFEKNVKLEELIKAGLAWADATAGEP